MKIRLNNVSFRYGRFFNTRLVLNGISGEIAPGITGILGPNGSGKSTLLNLITGKLRKGAGTLQFIDGRRAYSFGEYQKIGSIGYLPQRFKFVGGMSIRQTVEYVGWVNGSSGKDLADKVDEALNLVRLREHASLKTGQLSGGQCQRLGLACVLVQEPQVMILDEPTTGLDPESRILMRKCIADSASEGRTIIISTHHMEDLRYLAENVWVIAEGSLVFSGKIEDLGSGDVSDDSLKFGTAFEAGYSGLIQGLKKDSSGDHEI